MEKRRLQNINKCGDVPSTRTRQRCTSYSDTDEDKTAQHIGSYHSKKFGMAQPELADVLLDTDFILFFVMVAKTRRGGILNTVKILNSGESGNQRNGKTKSGGRNGKRGQQTFHVHTSIRKLAQGDHCFNCCPCRCEFSKFLCSLSHSTDVLFTDVASRRWQMS